MALVSALKGQSLLRILRMHENTLMAHACVPVRDLIPSTSYSSQKYNY